MGLPAHSAEGGFLIFFSFLLPPSCLCPAWGEAGAASVAGGEGEVDPVGYRGARFSPLLLCAEVRKLTQGT